MILVCIQIGVFKKKSLKMEPEVLLKSENRTTLVLTSLGFWAHERKREKRKAKKGD